MAIENRQAEGVVIHSDHGTQVNTYPGRSMNFEIERKFLVVGDGWKPLVAGQKRLA
jgi:hypothetical protein